MAFLAKELVANPQGLVDDEDFGLYKNLHGGIEINVLPSRKVRIEPRSQFKKRRQFAIRAQAPRAWHHGFCNQLKQGALARTILPQYADGLAFFYFKGYVAEGMKIPFPFAGDPEQIFHKGMNEVPGKSLAQILGHNG